VNLSRVVEEVTEVLHSSASSNGLTICTEIGPDLTELFLDPVRLKQVLNKRHVADTQTNCSIE
jgi:hypothetical protein